MKLENLTNIVGKSHSFYYSVQRGNNIHGYTRASHVREPTLLVSRSLSVNLLHNSIEGDVSG